MSLQTRLNALVTAIKTETKSLRTFISGANNGDVSGLNTTATNLVDALNEVKATADGAAGGGVAINDGATNTTQAWSSSKIDTEIAAAVNALIGGAPAALDTLNELAAALADDANYAASVTAQLATKANASDVYTQAQLGDPETDLVAIWNAA
ncbi:hypothetical protein GCM10016455_05970 [Aliiroseovarius zhejiangensis]|uniref:Uncharacterized protein n=1 Tax=Aliiroseovarius zhejiangensis TaxID=1632025 RepID=A0ABQ3IRG4_9RHOB|nr:hypothetical protein [Aliiroseovarius zhejiangensis]GHE88637.1 hypothetical protein GCM10016455_05970 [Aliiroseovarius zhejiangensis]